MSIQNMVVSIALLAALAWPPAWVDAATPDAGGPAEGSYVVLLDKPAQVIWGLGFEIQSDSIGSANKGLPDKVVAVPNNLVPEERARFYHDMLKGFRYCRLAMGLYLRGLDAEEKHVIERYPDQMKDLAEMQKESGIEGFEPEYWSPTPYWKSNDSYIKGTLKSFDDAFLGTFADALVQDVRYLEDHGLNVVQWGLQNEPVASTPYSSCVYSPDQYCRTFKAAAPKIKAAFPKVLIQATSWDGQGGKYGSVLQADPDALKYVDAWTWHRIGASSNQQIDEAAIFNANTHGRPVFNNEFEYLDNKTSDDRFVNTAQSILNWMVFVDSPTWFWLHALKPSYNAEASGYSLGFWRPQDDDDMTHFPTIQKGHWDYNPQNFNAIAGFLRHMPWDSRRINVREDQVRRSQRIMAYKTPEGKLTIVVTNRSKEPFTFHIDTGLDATFAGYRYTSSERDVPVGKAQGKVIAPTLVGQSIEFWAQE